MRATAHERPVQDQRRVWSKQRLRPVEQTQARLPGRDMDHVGAVHRIDRAYGRGPARAHHIHLEWRRHVRQSFVRGPRRNRSACIRIEIARLPGQPRQRARNEHRMLARAARDLQHAGFGRQHALQHLQNRRTVPLRCGRRQPAHRIRCSFKVASGPSNPPSPSVAHARPQANTSAEPFPPPARSSVQPNTTGLTTPAPNPTTERIA